MPRPGVLVAVSKNASPSASMSLASTSMTTALPARRRRHVRARHRRRVRQIDDNGVGRAPSPAVVGSELNFVSPGFVGVEVRRLRLVGAQCRRRARGFRQHVPRPSRNRVAVRVSRAARQRDAAREVHGLVGSGVRHWFRVDDGDLDRVRAGERAVAHGQQDGADAGFKEIQLRVRSRERVGVAIGIPYRPLVGQGLPVGVDEAVPFSTKWTGVWPSGPWSVALWSGPALATGARLATVISACAGALSDVPSFTTS